MRKELLSVENISAGQSESNAIHGVWLNLFAGQSLGLHGLYESGPSTLVQVISGKQRPTQGRLVIRGVRLTSYSEESARRSGIYLITGHALLIGTLSIAENIFIMRRGGLRLFWLRPQVMRLQAQRLLKELGTELPVATPVDRLTIAEKHLVELAKAVGAGCRIILFSYAFANYTQADLLRLSQIISKLKAQGYGVIINSSSLEELRLFCDDVALFRGSSISKKLPAVKLHKQDILRYIGADVAAHKGIVGDMSCTVEDQEMFCFRDVLPDGQTVEITLAAGKITSLICVDQFLRGTLFEVLAGMRHSLSAQFVCEGRSLAVCGTKERARYRIMSMASPDSERQYCANLSIAENLLLPSMKKSSGFLGFIHSGLYAAAQQDSSLGTITDVNTLSRGQWIALNFERWLIYHPRVAILLEPLAASDAVTEILVKDYIWQLAHSGAAVLLVSARVQGLEDISDHIMRIVSPEKEMCDE